MAWKRAKGRLFSNTQKDRMVQMVKSGMSKTEIIGEVGCHRSCLDYILVQRFGTPTIEPDSKELSLDAESPAGKKLDSVPLAFGAFASTPLATPGKPAEFAYLNEPAELAYLKWALEGALKKVRGVNYIDRIIADIRDGRLG